MENKIVMFSKPGCKYCENARSFLNTLQLQYKEIKLKPDEKNYEKKRDQLFNYYNHHSYPIIVINNEFVGGYYDLVRSYDTLKLHNMCSKIGIDLQCDF